MFLGRIKHWIKIRSAESVSQFKKLLKKLLYKQDLDGIHSIQNVILVCTLYAIVFHKAPYN